MESTHAHRQLLWENVWKKIKDSHAIVERHPGYGESWKKIKEMWSVIGWSQNEKPDVEVPGVPERVSIENASSHGQPLEEIPSITHTWELHLSHAELQGLVVGHQISAVPTIKYTFTLYWQRRLPEVAASVLLPSDFPWTVKPFDSPYTSLDSPVYKKSFQFPKIWKSSVILTKKNCTWQS